MKYCYCWNMYLYINANVKIAAAWFCLTADAALGKCAWRIVACYIRDVRWPTAFVWVTVVADMSSGSWRIQKSIGFLKIQLLSNRQMSRRQEQIRSFFPGSTESTVCGFERGRLRLSLKTLRVFSQIHYGKNVLPCKIYSNHPSVVYVWDLLGFNNKSQL